MRTTIPITMMALFALAACAPKAPPALPTACASGDDIATPAPVCDLVYARSFTLATGFKYNWYNPLMVTSGTVVVLKVSPDLVIPRSAPMPVLYVGNNTGMPLNHGHESGRVIAIMLGSLDQTAALMWYGSPNLPEQVDVLAQSLRPEKLCELQSQLWQRGDADDPRAIETIRAANPRAPTPSFLTAPADVVLRCWLPPERAPEATTLVSREYWNADLSELVITRSHQHSAAWVGIEDHAGRLIATARAVGDTFKHATILDVAVAAGWRGRGIGKRLLRLLLDHPAVRQATHVRLRTKDAQQFYRALGFTEAPAKPDRPTTMERRQTRRPVTVA